MKSINKLAAGAVLGLASVAARADGDITSAITAAATQAKTDIGSAAVVIIGVVVAIAAVGWVRRVIK